MRNATDTRKLTLSSRRINIELEIEETAKKGCIKCIFDYLADDEITELKENGYTIYMESRQFADIYAQSPYVYIVTW
jgi:hypothetical protein